MTTPTADPSLALVNLTVRDAMRADVVACRPDDDLASLAGRLAGERVHTIVLDPGGGGTRLIVTDLDVLRAALSGRTEIRAHELTRDPLICVSAGLSVDELARMRRRSRAGRPPRSSLRLGFGVRLGTAPGPASQPSE